MALPGPGAFSDGQYPTEAAYRAGAFCLTTSTVGIAPLRHLLNISNHLHHKSTRLFKFLVGGFCI